MNTLLLILGGISALYGIWFALIALLGAFRPLPARKHFAPQKRFAVLIPARNEAGVVGFLIKSLLRQAYPASLFQVIVIPNHCTDDTAQAARAAGARVLECAEPTHCKGDVLRFAFRALASENFDGYCILDADNLAASGFLSAANDALCQGMEIAQGYRDSKNPSDSWVAGDTSLFFWMMSRFYNRARSALGMSAALNGTGIVLSRALVERMGWNTCSLTEDLEFSAQCALNGVKIGFLPDAVIYDEQPVGLKDSMVQRRRWFSGTIQCFRHYGLLLLRTGSLQAMDMLAVFSGCVVQALGLISGLLTAVQLILGLWEGTLQVQGLLLSGAGMALMAYLACALFAWILCLLEKKGGRRKWSAILMFPLFLVTWLPANVWALFTPPPAWKPIAHVRATDRPE